MKCELTDIYKSDDELLDSDTGVDEPLGIVIKTYMYLHMRLLPQKISPASGQVFRAQARSNWEAGRRGDEVRSS